MDMNPKTGWSSRRRVWCAVVATAGVSLLATACGSSSATSTPPSGAVVLTPAYAKTAGFPVTLDPAKTSAVTTQKGCSSSVGAVYADQARTTGLIASDLNCDSAASAAAAFAVIKKHYGVDAAMAVPKGLGTSAFGTASIAPQYLMVWQTGNKVAITAVDVNLAASASTSSTVASPPLTQAQEGILARAAEAQNALLQ